MSITDLSNELKVTESGIGEKISYSFVENNNILKVLEKYDVPTLELVKLKMDKYQFKLSKEISNKRSNCDADDNNQPDSTNLINDVNVIKVGMHKVQCIINKKRDIIMQKQFNSFVTFMAKIFMCIMFILIMIAVK